MQTKLISSGHIRCEICGRMMDERVDEYDNICSFCLKSYDENCIFDLKCRED